MKRAPPPPVIDSARVLAYAFVDDIPYRRAGSFFVDGKLLEQVPCLAIAQNLGEDIGPLIFHCDEDWNAVGTSGAPTIEEVKRDAERNYPGVSTQCHCRRRTCVLRLSDGRTEVFLLRQAAVRGQRMD